MTLKPFDLSVRYPYSASLFSVNVPRRHLVRHIGVWHKWRIQGWFEPSHHYDNNESTT